MSEEPEESRITRRAQLLPEEQATGSADPELQAKLILQESDERIEDPEGTRRKSTQTPD